MWWTDHNETLHANQFLTAGLQQVLPDSPHHSALYVTTPVEPLPIKNVISHVDSGQTAYVT